jgi:hypothetical protein
MIHTVRETTDYYRSPADSPLPELTKAEALRRLLAAHVEPTDSPVYPMDVRTSIRGALWTWVSGGFASLRPLRNNRVDVCGNVGITQSEAPVSRDVVLPLSARKEKPVKL